MTSGPMPSAGMTAIRNGIGYSIIAGIWRRFSGHPPVASDSADRRKGPERGAGQDAPPAPGSPAFGAYLLGGLGIRRPGVPAAAGRRHRRARLRLTLRRLDEAVEDLPGAPAVERLPSHHQGPRPVVSPARRQHR